MENRDVFKKVLPVVFDVEGGFVNHPNDPGGPTMHGVAWNFNAGYLREKFGLTAATMESLTKEQAEQCYWDNYWAAAGCDKISDEGLAYLHFDTAVNNGVGAAQRILSRLSVDPRQFDGRGDRNEILFLRLVMEYMVLRLDLYTQCKNRKTFLEGWINRMETVMTYARKLV